MKIAPIGKDIVLTKSNVRPNARLSLFLSCPILTYTGNVTCEITAATSVIGSIDNLYAMS